MSKCTRCGREAVVLHDNSATSQVNGIGLCSECATKELQALRGEMALQAQKAQAEKPYGVTGFNATIPQHEDYTPNEIVREMLDTQAARIAELEAELREASGLVGTPEGVPFDAPLLTRMRQNHQNYLRNMHSAEQNKIKAEMRADAAEAKRAELEGLLGRVSPYVESIDCTICPFIGGECTRGECSKKDMLDDIARALGKE